jgi:hypothetical protein
MVDDQVRRRRLFLPHPEPPDDSCVVRHGKEVVRAGAIGLGAWSVSVAHIAREDPSRVTIIESSDTHAIVAASGQWGGKDHPPACQPGQICE